MSNRDPYSDSFLSRVLFDPRTEKSCGLRLTAYTVSRVRTVFREGFVWNGPISQGEWNGP